MSNSNGQEDHPHVPSFDPTFLSTPARRRYRPASPAVAEEEGLDPIFNFTPSRPLTLLDIDCERTCISERLLRCHPKLFNLPIHPYECLSVSIDGSTVETIGIINTRFPLQRLTSPHELPRCLQSRLQPHPKCCTQRSPWRQVFRHPGHPCHPGHPTYYVPDFVATNS